MIIAAREKEGITFPVDSVEPAKEPLKSGFLLECLERQLRLNVLLASEPRQSVCAADRVNPLVWAIHAAFSQHRPLTLSPDDIWLTIEQGFGHHIAENAESLRHRLVRHEGKRSLRAENCLPSFEGFTTAIASFSTQVRDATDPVLFDTLVCDFSTTTPIIRTASQIALMSAYSTYFVYQLGCVCGIPSVTLRGTPEDWRRIRERVEVLAVYDLEWWVSRLRPVLDELVRTAEGNPDTAFWKGIYKPFKFYAVTSATGWITDRFPYLGESPDRIRSHVFQHERRGWALPVSQGVSTSLISELPGESVSLNSFPCGLSSAPVELSFADGTRRDVDFIAGLLAVQQAADSLSLSPLIGWCVADKPPAATIDTEPETALRFLGGIRRRDQNSYRKLN